MRVRIRKRYRVLVFAAIVAALVVPVGYALSIEPQPIAKYARNTVVTTAATSVMASPVAIRADAGRTVVGEAAGWAEPDSAKLLLVGTILLGLAAMVRKAI